MTTVLCWDIDGTLLTTGRAGVFALEDAARDVVGHTVDLTQINTAGITDVAIAQAILSSQGIEPVPEKVTRLLQLYGEYLPAALPRRQGEVMPGVIEILEAIQDLPNVLSILLTGNIQAGAQAKLNHYGLVQYFTQGGSFSDHALDRADIARKALKLAQSLVGDVSLDRVYVIGDTPHDIHCGKAINARTIAIATGSYSLEHLKTHDPWWSLEKLPDSATFLAKLSL
jgi:phosphoglycolate phosphatase